MDRDAAWDSLWAALPARWKLGRPSYDPGVLRAYGYRGAWSVTARGPHPGHGKSPQTVRGIGEDETAALRDLDERLRGVPKPDGTRLDELGRRLRLACVDGAEEWTRDSLSGGMTSQELERA